MPTTSLQPKPAAGAQSRMLAAAAHQAAQTVCAHATAGRCHGFAWAPWPESVADLPAYVPVCGSTDWTAERLQLADRVIASHRATAAAAPDTCAAVELAAVGIHVYAEKILEHAPDSDPILEWERAARFGPSALYAGMRTLSAAVLTARAVSGWPDYAAHLEAVRRWWLVDWVVDGDDVWVPGTDDDHALLAALGEAIADCGDLANRPPADAGVLARLWGSIAGPGPEVSPLHRRQIAGQGVLLLDLADPYLQDRSRTLPTWSPAVSGPEEMVLAAEVGELQARVEASMPVRDRAVLHAYLAGGKTWTQAAAAAAPHCGDPEALGERVRRRLKRFGLEDLRRCAGRRASVLGLPARGASR